ncbi:hypothetical protein JYU34_009037 [Plutella xylostella]|uniref:Uncharacterized protein n=1 Tax=Plutella xylostella TaxID=51655 RepID=A0ABQ7QMF2_PLUXY|nr:hypothetical protein JYU34_009037 [Plutella xylostella]
MVTLLLLFTFQVPLSAHWGASVLVAAGEARLQCFDRALAPAPAPRAVAPRYVAR